MRFALTLIALLIAAPSWAAWQGTANWTRSPGPNLSHEELLADVNQDGTPELVDPSCWITAPTTPACTFLVQDADMAGQPLIVRSYSPEGAYSDYQIGTLTTLPVPDPATAGTVVYVFVP